MRNDPTEPERRMWMALRSKRLAGFKFRRQATIGTRIADFFCPAKGLIIEIDGDTHDRAVDLQRDLLVAREFGFVTFRCTNREVMENMEGVLTGLLVALEARPDRWADGRNTTPQPPPLKRRGSESA